MKSFEVFMSQYDNSNLEVEFTQIQNLIQDDVNPLESHEIENLANELNAWRSDYANDAGDEIGLPDGDELVEPLDFAESLNTFDPDVVADESFKTTSTTDADLNQFIKVRKDFTLAMAMDQELDNTLKETNEARIDAMMNAVVTLRTKELKSSTKKTVFKALASTALVATVVGLSGVADAYIPPELLNAISSAQEILKDTMEVTTNLIQNSLGNDAFPEPSEAIACVKDLAQGICDDGEYPKQISEGANRLLDGLTQESLPDGNGFKMGLIYLVGLYALKLVGGSILERLQNDAINQYADDMFKGSASAERAAMPINLLFGSIKQLSVPQIRSMTEILEARFFENDMRSKAMGSYHLFFQSIKDASNKFDYELNKTAKAASTSEPFEFSAEIKNALAMTLVISRDTEFDGWASKRFYELKELLLRKYNEFIDPKAEKTILKSLGTGVSGSTRKMAGDVLQSLGLETSDKDEVDFKGRAKFLQRDSVKHCIIEDIKWAWGDEPYSSRTLKAEMVATTGYVELLQAIADGGTEAEMVVSKLTQAGFDIKDDLLLMDINKFSSASLRTQIRDLQPKAYVVFKRMSSEFMVDYKTEKELKADSSHRRTFGF